MLTGMPLEDFHRVADTVIHVIKDKDPTYHSYHNPTHAVVAGISILADLNIREGLDFINGIHSMESGKGSFKQRAIMDGLTKYGAHAKPQLEALRTRKAWLNIEKNKRLKRNWKKLVDAVENDKNPRKLITLEEAVSSGKE